MIDKFLRIFTWAVRGCFVLMIIYSAAVGNIKPMTDATTGFFLTFVPIFFRAVVRLVIPVRLEAFFILFVFLANFLGSCIGFYDLFKWWDILLHASSGAFLAIISLSFIDSAIEGRSIRDWNPWVLSLLVFTFAISCGTLWEFYEYAMDVFFDYGMQKHTLLPDGTIDTGIIDTMTDELCAAASALVYTVSVLVCAKTGKYRYMEQFLIKRK